jgi:uncharacterized protein YggE
MRFIDWGENNNMRSVFNQPSRAVSALALSVALALTVLGKAQAHEGHEPPRLITTQGHGEVKVRPDSLSVNVRVETKNEKLPMARSENNRKAQEIVSALKALNIPNLKLETQGLNVYPVQEYQKDKLPKVVGYQVSNGLVVTVTGATPDVLGEYGSRIVDTALNSGANHVDGLNFFLNDPTPARNQALSLAVKDARRNADVMAKAADINIVGVYSMEGNAQFGSFPRPVPMYAMKSRMAVAEADSAPPVETGETTVTSDVTVRFKF